MGSKDGTEFNLGQLIWDGVKHYATCWLRAIAGFILICLSIDGRLF